MSICRIGLDCAVAELLKVRCNVAKTNTNAVARHQVEAIISPEMPAGHTEDG